MQNQYRPQSRAPQSFLGVPTCGKTLRAFIVGAVGSGKTEMLRALAERGYRTVPEIAPRTAANLQLINEHHGTFPDWFETSVLLTRLRLEQYQKVKQDDCDSVVFFDRSPVDSFGFFTPPLGLADGHRLDASDIYRTRKDFISCVLKRLDVDDTIFIFCNAPIETCRRRVETRPVEIAIQTDMADQQHCNTILMRERLHKFRILDINTDDTNNNPITNITLVEEFVKLCLGDWTAPH